MRMLFFIITLFISQLSTQSFAAITYGEDELIGSKNKEISKQQLDEILKNHKIWLKSNGKHGKRGDLSHKNLNSLKLSKLNLSGINLSYSNLVGTDLSETNLSNSKMSDVDLSNAILVKTDLSNAILTYAYIINANLTEASLAQANLSDSDLSGSNFSKTSFQEAKLNNAILEDVEMDGAFFLNADLTNTVFECRKNSLPEIVFLAYAENLNKLKYNDSAHSLIELRSQFKTNGFRHQEREITYAIQHSRMLDSYINGSIGTKIKSIIEYIFIDLTCKWGMAPSLPLLLILILIFFFSVFYYFSLRKSLKIDGIWMTWMPERARKDLGREEPELLCLNKLSAIKIAFYFSVLSAFNIGWRDLNLGNWISRLHPKEFTFQATGYIRTISGLQSLISVYLLGLSMLSIFSRPFDGY